MKLRVNLLTTLQGAVREETFDGETYTVARAVGLVEGVHSGSLGPVYYPPHVIGRNVHEHNGAPLTIDHPEEDGRHVSANSPRVMERQVVGRLFNFSFDADKTSLDHEVWINDRKAQRLAPETLAKVKAGEPTELSTGLWTDDDGIPGAWRGEEYEASVTAFRIDHEAILRDAVGACSLEDGCGVNPRLNIRSTARTPKFEGTETTRWGGVKTTFEAYRDAYYRSHAKPAEIPSRVQDAPSGLKTWVASKTLLGDGAADNDRDLIFFPVVNPRTDKLNERALYAVISGRGAQADIDAGAKRSAQNKARSLLNKHFGAELEVQMGSENLVKRLWGAASSVVNAVLGGGDMSHEDLRGKVQKALDGLDKAGWMHFVRDVYDGHVVYLARGTNPNEEGGAAEKLYSRTFTVDEESGEVALADTAIEVAERPREYVPVAGNQETEIGETAEGENTMTKKEEAVAALIACERTRFTDEHREWLLTLDEGQLDVLKAPDLPVTEKEAPKDETPPATRETANETAELTPRQWLDSTKAPPSVREPVERWIANEKAAKAALTKAMLANRRCPFEESELMAMDIPKLRALANYGTVEVSFEGSGGGPSDLQANAAPDPEPIWGRPIWGSK